MAIFKIGTTDFSDCVAGLKVSYETLVSDESGRNANGDMTIDVVNTKVKVSVSFRSMTAVEAQSFLAAVNDYVINITFIDPKSNQAVTKQVYIGSPALEYLWIWENNNVRLKNFSLNFIEL